MATSSIVRITLFIASLAMIVIFINDVSAYPYPDDSNQLIGFEDSVQHFNEQPNFEVHHIEKRATCDFLSAFGVGHAACAAHCVAKGFRGGWCDGRAVCNCRR